MRFTKLLRFWPILILILLCGYLFKINYLPGTYLTGWDNLHPEFDFLLNIKRSLFSVWEEYQGLGLLGGHAHSSDLIRQLILFGLSNFLPASILRYLSTICMFFLGGVGAYMFSRYFIFPTRPRSFSFLVSLFYLLNLATIQTFYVPFEAFIAHFASLPWLLFGSLNYLKKPSTTSLILLILILLFSTPAAYIPTLFLVFLIVLTIMLLPYFLEKNRKVTFFRILKLYTIIFLINAFWILPFLYFTATNSSVNIESKINQSATQTIYLQNKEFGTLDNLMLLKGFWFKSIDPNFDGVFTYMLAPWQNHFANPLILILGYVFFLVILLGFIYCIKAKEPLLRGIALLFLFVFIALAVATPPFSWINQLIRQIIPLLDQAFRFPFTKFSLFAAFIYALLFVKGIEYILQKAGYLVGRSRIKLVGILFILSGILIIYTFPLFTGNLFYEKEKIALPKEYHDLFTYFSKEDPHTRIANLPQYTFWGWNFYRFGYGGSGFLWYGIGQPILDRAFDVWSSENENYYYEMSRAIYTKNPKLVEGVINKYQISWLIIDRNIMYPPSPRALLLDELDPLLLQIPGIQLTKTFGNITIYKTALKNRPSSFIYTTSSLPKVNPYIWDNHDKAYEVSGDYQTSDDQTDFYYPFRSLFTDKTEKEREFEATDSGPTITFFQSLPDNLDQQTLHIPSLLQTESILPITLESVATNNSLTVQAVFTSPQISLGDMTSGGETIRKTLFTVSRDALTRSPIYTLNNNGVVNFSLGWKTGVIGQSFVSLKQPNVFTLNESVSKAASRAVITPIELQGLPIYTSFTIPFTTNSPKTLSVTLPKIDDDYLSATLNPDQFSSVHNCDNFRKGTVKSNISTIDNRKELTLETLNATACVPFYLPSLPHAEGYAIFISSRNHEGRSLHFWMENTDAKSGSLDTYLPDSKEEVNTAFILPPLDQYGNAYALHFDNISVGKERSKNTLSRVSIYPIPYAFLKSLVFSEKEAFPTEVIASKDLIVHHPNESSYIVTGIPSSAKTLILSQSYNKGWQAYQMTDTNNPNAFKTTFPFLFGKHLEHVKINNWSNGWKLTDNQQSTTNNQIVIVYLPQYLQYLGFLLLFITLGYFLLRFFVNRKS